jgi:hypothetical protein
VRLELRAVWPSGVLRSLSTAPSAMTDDGEDVTLGIRPDGPNDAIDGIGDEVRRWAMLRSSESIATEHDTLRQGSTEVTVGLEERL